MSTARGPGSPTIRITLNVTPEMLAALQTIARESGQPLEGVFTRAIALYHAAIRAIAEGKHIGIATDADGLEVEFTDLVGPGA